MAEIAGKVDFKDIAKNNTMLVGFKNAKQWRWRLWVAGQLIRLAAWIAWMGVEISIEENEF